MELNIYSISALVLSYALGCFVGHLSSKRREKKEREAEKYLTAIGVYDEKVSCE